jgi:hypothetical protein
MSFSYGHSFFSKNVDVLAPSCLAATMIVYFFPAPQSTESNPIGGKKCLRSALKTIKVAQQIILDSEIDVHGYSKGARSNWPE